MNKAMGFLIEDIPMCCVCAERYAKESGFPNLFFMANRLIRMDPNKRCCCGEYPNTMEALNAGKRIVMMLDGQT